MYKIRTFDVENVHFNIKIKYEPNQRKIRTHRKGEKLWQIRLVDLAAMKNLNLY